MIFFYVCEKFIKDNVHGQNKGFSDVENKQVIIEFKS